jgi:hypothetical protein
MAWMCAAALLLPLLVLAATVAVLRAANLVLGQVTLPALGVLLAVVLTALFTWRDRLWAAVHAAAPADESAAAVKVLPPGWREELHQAPSRTYSVYHGPNGEKARSIAEAIRLHEATGGGAVSSAVAQAPKGEGGEQRRWGEVRSLSALCAALDRSTDARDRTLLAALRAFEDETRAAPRLPTTPAAAMAETGAKLVGDQGGFACTVCHDVGKAPATAPFEAPALNLAWSAERLRLSYYERWLLNPQRVDPETKMPRYSDSNVRTQPKQVLDGDGRRQFDAIREYLLKLAVE